jgi:hypothetical protein
MRHFITRGPPADGGEPIGTDLHRMTDDGCPHSPIPARWDGPDWRDNLGEWDTFDDEDQLAFPATGGAAVAAGNPDRRTEPLPAPGAGGADPGHGRLPRPGRPGAGRSGAEYDRHSAGSAGCSG